MNPVSRLLIDLCPDVLTDSDNMAGRFHTDKAAVIGLAVKFSVNLHTALSEFLPDIIGKFNISPVDIRHFPKFCIKFINFLIHVRHLFILSFLLTHVT